MNEVPLGFNWPSASVRLARTTEAIQIINKLWEEGKIGNDDDGFVNFSGQYFKIKNAKLYTSHSSEKKYPCIWQPLERRQPKLLQSILMV
jgi:alkanesulfonate monooxygenase SsuD/methylene tetrahydromethanopterin reductase-like flavin-dependent oxidoreductase (luciferase family)